METIWPLEYLHQTVWLLPVLFLISQVTHRSVVVGQITQVAIFTVARKLFLIQAAPVIAKSMQERAQPPLEATWVENIICRDSILQRVTSRWCIFIITPPTITSQLIHRPNLVEMSKA
jgi:hypothetical protein